MEFCMKTYKNETQVQMLLESATFFLRILVELYAPRYQVIRYYVALNCSHYNPIMIQRLHQYLDKYTALQSATSLLCDISLDSDKLEDISKVHRKLFRSGVINSL
ncbi:hypothetical protein T10_10640 [Trichinella papuae]|uniref:Uncharacterized protein n=1 Tax=Trichinella papuae TaxID=268474 RepID=A0A0V1MC75_9BILA|nr:hypothetical protein T10_10640 [Trichinella papuae]